MTTLVQEAIYETVEAAYEEGIPPQQFLEEVASAWEHVARERLAQHRERWAKALTAIRT